MRPHTPTAGVSPEGSGRTERLGSEQLEHELDLARQIQRSLFPSPLPKMSGMRLAAVNHPARIVSGDLYDVIVIDPERIAILCADVSGKGFPAALLASELRAYVRATLRAACVFADASLGPLPVQVVALLNNETSRQNKSGRYATMFFAEYDVSERSLRYVNAGQNPPLLVIPARESFAELTTGGPPVGLFEDAAYDVGTVTLPDEGTVLIYTDGVVEARNPEGEEFGLARLIDVCATRHDGPGALLAAVLDAVRIWSSQREQEDDITLVALAVVDE
ncbi:MAG: PP2C family protein-serine/threonine phosphatase [Vicinamibacteria bacterium]